jgi:hypothetical protein
MDLDEIKLTVFSRKSSLTILQQSNPILPTPSKKSDDEEEIDNVKPRELEFSSSMLLYVQF